MKLILNFTTDLFNSTESKSHFINDRCFGEDLVVWLVERTKSSGFRMDDPFQEDWGWATLARKNNETFLVGAGIMDESIGQVPAEWMIVIEKMRRFIILGSRKSPNLNVLATEIENVLTNEPRIKDLSRTSEP